MRILAIYEFFWPALGGDEVAARDLLPRIQAMGHDVKAIVSAREPGLPACDEVDGVAVHRLGLREALQNGDVSALGTARAEGLRAWREFAPDIVHCWILGPAVTLLEAGIGESPVPLILKVDENMWAGGRLDPVTERVSRRAAAMMTITELATRELAVVAPWTEDRTELIPYGVRDPTAAPAPLPVKPFVFGSLSRLIPEKGLDVMLRAFARVRARHDCRLLIGGHGPELGRLMALADELGLGADVEFTGPVALEESHAWLNRVAGVLMPSRSELQGLVAIEAAQMARPVIASRVGGLTETLKSTGGGELVPAGDVGALARAMKGFVVDPERAAALGERARPVALERYDAQRFAERVMAMYDDALAKPVAPVRP